MEHQFKCREGSHDEVRKNAVENKTDTNEYM